MSLRELVSGAGCSADGASGSAANPAASFADALLGGNAKVHEGQLRQPPGLSELHGGARGWEPEAAAFAQEGAFSAPLVDAHGRPSAQHSPGGDFFRAFHGGPHAAQFAQPDGGPAFSADAPPQRALAGCLQSFVASGRSGVPMSPVPLPELGLSPAEKQRIRDRSGILARHMFMEGGERFAEQQVGALLASLHIEPSTLDGGMLPRFPTPGGVAGEWANDFLGPPTGAALAAGSAWSDEFGAQQQQRLLVPPPHMQRGRPWMPHGADAHPAPSSSSMRTGAEWAQSFTPPAERADAAAAPAWGVDDFLAERAAAVRLEREGGAAMPDGASSAQTRALVQTLAANQEPKFQNSKFLQFVSKMSRGELIFEGNGVRERAAAPPGDWGEEFARAGPSSATGAAWGREFAEAASGSAPRAGAAGDWASEFARVPAEWAEEFSRVHGVPPDGDGDWLDAYDEFVAQNAAPGAHDAEAAWAAAAARRGDYEFAPNNPYLQHPDPLAHGLELFRRGVLSEAVLALEAAAQRDPAACEPWRLLGTVHAENDDDRRAIAAMARALAAQPENREVLLSLGVSHTNELDAETAVGYVSAWLAQHPTLRHLAPPPSGAPLPDVLAAFRAAAAEAPQDADVHTVLGVLYNLAREYDAAIDAFTAALALSPGDYSLWNKLGATQANSARSGEALAAYRRALDLKPNYVRAWCNMGIGFANQGAYAQSAAYYVRALSLNPAADNVWGYLRISLSCIGREDLMPALDAHDLAPLLREFPL